MTFLAIAVGMFNFKEPVNPWANTKRAVDVCDIEAYNKAMGKLFFLYGLVFILLGLPLIPGQNSALIVITILGLVFESIFLMRGIIKIEEKYRKCH